MADFCIRWDEDPVLLFCMWLASMSHLLPVHLLRIGLPTPFMFLFCCQESVGCKHLALFLHSDSVPMVYLFIYTSTYCCVHSLMVWLEVQQCDASRFSFCSVLRWLCPGLFFWFLYEISDCFPGSVRNDTMSTWWEFVLNLNCFCQYGHFTILILHPWSMETCFVIYLSLMISFSAWRWSFTCRDLSPSSWKYRLPQVFSFYFIFACCKGSSLFVLRTWVIGVYSATDLCTLIILKLFTKFI